MKQSIQLDNPDKKRPLFGLQALRLTNFKRFEVAAFRFDANFTVLVGDNASGKTAVLEASAIALGAFTDTLPEGEKLITDEAVRTEIRYSQGAKTHFSEQQFPCEISARMCIDNEFYECARSRDSLGKGTWTPGENILLTLSRQRIDAVAKGEDVTLPVLCFYGTGRLWAEELGDESNGPESRLVGYRQALSGRSKSLQLLRTMKRLTFASLQRGSPSPLLQGIVSAVRLCVPGATELEYDVSRDQLTVVINGQAQDFGMLSHGYRGMLGLVADLAYRTAMLNPHFGADAHRLTPGIVLIDELDLHLHPKWQREVVGHLRLAFPAVQFIATTHSPFVIQALEPGQLIDMTAQGADIAGLADDEFVAFPPPSVEFSSQGVEEIAENVMNVESAHRNVDFVEAEKRSIRFLEIIESLGSEGIPQSSQSEELDDIIKDIKDPAVAAMLKLQRAAKLKE